MTDHEEALTQKLVELGFEKFDREKPRETIIHIEAVETDNELPRNSARRHAFSELTYPAFMTVGGLISMTMAWVRCEDDPWILTGKELDLREYGFTFTDLFPEPLH